MNILYITDIFLCLAISGSPQTGGSPQGWPKKWVPPISILRPGIARAAASRGLPPKGRLNEAAGAAAAALVAGIEMSR
jgi:hypothetical protein